MAPDYDIDKIRMMRETISAQIPDLPSFVLIGNGMVHCFQGETMRCQKDCQTETTDEYQVFLLQKEVGMFYLANITATNALDCLTAVKELLPGRSWDHDGFRAWFNAYLDEADLRRVLQGRKFVKEPHEGIEHFENMDWIQPKPEPLEIAWSYDYSIPNSRRPGGFTGGCTVYTNSEHNRIYVTWAVD